MNADALAPMIDELVQERLATGKYRSREDVLLEALGQLAEHDQTIADLEQSTADEASGRVRDADDVFHEIEAKYKLSESP